MSFTESFIPSPSYKTFQLEFCHERGLRPIAVDQPVGSLVSFMMIVCFGAAMYFFQTRTVMENRLPGFHLLTA
jgi:hypothetical protein